MNREKDEAKARFLSAKNYYDECIGFGPACNNVPETYEKNIAQSLLAISAALADIRDALRIMNERSDDNGKT